VAGAAAWVLAAFACLVVLWAAARRAVRTGPGGNDGGHQGSPMPPVAATPLVTGMVVAMAVSLIVAG